jgi:hypothetical protein
MRDLLYFRRIKDGLDVAPALAILNSQPSLWRIFTGRQLYEGSAHADTETIILRGPTTLENVFDNLDSDDHVVTQSLQSVVQLIHEAIASLEAREVGRALLVRLKPRGAITPHTDEGRYARYYARFHIPLCSPPDCLFSAGDESVHMAPGELWWFNHQVPHSVTNGAEPRIHLIVDLCAPGFTGAIG